MDTLAPQGINASGYNASALPGQIGSLDPTLVPTPVPAVTSTVNSSTLAPATPIPYTTPATTPAYPVGTLDTTIPTPPAVPTPSETQANSLTDTLKALNASLVGKSADQTAANTAAGVDTAQKTITDLSAQLSGLQNEAKAIPLSLQNDATGRGITAAGLAPIQSAQLRDNAVKALTVSTLLQAAQGNLANAQAQADKVITQKYGPIQEQITAATANLNLILNSPEYSLEEKNRAQTQLDAQNAKQVALDKAKSDAAAVLTTAQNAAANGTDAITLQKITAAKTPAEALKIAGASGVTTAKNTQIVSIGGRQKLVDTKTGNTIRDLGPVTQTPTSENTATLGSDLAFALNYLKNNPNTDPNTAKQDFLVRHPTASAAWDSYFGVTANGDNYPKAPPPAKTGLFGLGFFGL